MALPPDPMALKLHDTIRILGAQHDLIGPEPEGTEGIVPGTAQPPGASSRAARMLAGACRVGRSWEQVTQEVAIDA